MIWGGGQPPPHASPTPGPGSLAVMDYAARTLWYALLLLAAARVLNRRTLVSDKPWDFAVNVTYGTLAGSAILNRSTPVWGGTAAIAALTVFAWLANAATARWSWVSAALAGRAVTLVRQGRVQQDNLRRLHMTEADLRAKLREAQVGDLADVELAELETDGRFGIVRRRPQGGS